jgi:hypothetical protein
MNDVVLALRNSGMRIEDDWLRRIGPAHFGHINFRGTMRLQRRAVRRVLDPGTR